MTIIYAVCQYARFCFFARIIFTTRIFFKKNWHL